MWDNSLWLRKSSWRLNIKPSAAKVPGFLSLNWMGWAWAAHCNIHPLTQEDIFTLYERKVLCVWLSHVQLFGTPWSVACQALLSMEFSRKEILQWVAISFSIVLMYSPGNSSFRFVCSLFLRKPIQEMFARFSKAVITATGLRIATHTYFLFLMPILDRCHHSQVSPLTEAHLLGWSEGYESLVIRNFSSWCYCTWATESKWSKGISRIPALRYLEPEFSSLP